MVDRQSYEDKKQELKYHKDKGIICLIYDPAELLGTKRISLKEQALKRVLKKYEMYFIRPLKKIREKISQIESGKIYLGPKRRHSRLESYLNFLASHLKNMEDIMSVLERQLTVKVNFGDMSSVKENLSPVISTVKGMVKEYKVVARCKPFQGFRHSYVCFLDVISSAIDQLVNQVIQIKQRMKDGNFEDFEFVFGGDKIEECSEAFEQNRKEYIRKTRQQALGCSTFILFGIIASGLVVVLILLSIK